METNDCPGRANHELDSELANIVLQPWATFATYIQSEALTTSQGCQVWGWLRTGQARLPTV